MSRTSTSPADGDLHSGRGSGTAPIGGPSPMVVLGVLVGLAGVAEAIERVKIEGSQGLPTLAIGLGLGLAVGLGRYKPGAALSLVWVIAVIQVLSQADGMLTEAASVIVLYAASRYGSTAVVWASGLSLPLIYLAGALYVQAHGTGLSVILGATALARMTSRPTVALALAVGLALIIPWLLGLTLRMRAQARANLTQSLRAETMRAVAESRRAEAEELARVKDEQAQLARDLHDVIGHSLTVILAQAQSAAYVPDDPARLKEIMTTIATSARRSLGDMRGVLSATPHPETSTLDTLIAPLEEAGRTVEYDVTGRPRPLPPDIAVVAYRVMQEMLTNALKHGVPSEPIKVSLDWGRALRMEVGNAVNGRAEVGNGLGLDGMRARLASVQGTLRTERAATGFVAAASIPLSPNTMSPIPSTDERRSEHP